MKRLVSLSPELAITLQNMTPTQQNALKYFACNYAIETAGLTDQSVLSALIDLKTIGSIPLDRKQQLEELMNDLDSRYFELEELDLSDGTATDYFHKARAIAAVLEARKNDTLDASTDAIYEASMTSSNQQELIDLLLSLVDSSPEELTANA